MSELIHLPQELVATPRELDKSWARIQRGDRGCLFDAMSLLGAVLTIVAVAYAKAFAGSWIPAYIAGGTWALGFVLGTRAQWKSGTQRREALTHGPLVALGVIEAEEALSQGGGRRAPVGRALVLMADEPQDSAKLRDVKEVCAAARALKELLDAGQISNPDLQALRDDRFSFVRVKLADDSILAGRWIVTRLIAHGDRLGPGRSTLREGEALWAIYHRELDILEQALCGSS